MTAAPDRDYRPDVAHVYHCDVLFTPEDGMWIAVCLNLPGAASQGKTYDEAKRNVTEAIQGCIESYVIAGDSIPWRDSSSDAVPVKTTLSVEVTHAE